MNKEKTPSSGSTDEDGSIQEGIALGKETLEIPKSLIQEYLDKGLTKKEAIEKAKIEFLESKESEALESNTIPPEEKHEVVNTSSEDDGKWMDDNSTQNKEILRSEKQEETGLEDDGKWLDTHHKGLEEKASGTDKEKIKEEEKKLKEVFEKQTPKEKNIEEPEKETPTTKQILESLSDEKIKEKAEKIADEAVEKVLGNQTNTQKTGLQEESEKKVEEEPRGLTKEEARLKTAFAEKFNITEKEYSELEKNEDFKNLSHGQKLFVLKNLEQVSLDKTLMESQERFDASLAQSGSLGKVWKNIRKEYLLAGHKRDIAKEIAGGGFAAHKNTIEQLTNRALMMNVPMIENEKGELEMQFGKIDKNMTDRERDAVREYNQKATTFAFTPHEWASWVDGSKKEGDAYRKNDDAFRDTEELYALLVKKYSLPEDYSVNRKIKLQQFLTTNPNAEKIMNSLNSDTNQWKRLVGKDLLVERGVYTGLGYAARGMAPLLNIAQVGAPISAFVLGSIRGGLRADRNLDRKAKEARRGKQDTSKTAKNFMDAFSSKKDREDGGKVRSLGERLEDLVSAYQGADTLEDRKLIAQQLYNRSQYTLRKMSDGLINFGNDEMRIANQTRLMETIALAESYAAINTEAGLATANRLENILDIRGSRIKGRERMYIAKEALKAGAFGAGFATAGLMGREIVHGVKEWFAVDSPSATTENPLIPRYHTQVATETPNTHIVGKAPVPPHHTVGTIPKPEGIDHGYIAERDDTYVAMPEPNVHIVSTGHDLPVTPPPAPPYHPSELEIKPVEIKFDHGHGAIATFKELKEKLLQEYKGVPENKIPESVKTILHESPTKLAERFGFYNPNDPFGAESALVIKGSSLSIDSAGNLDYHHVGQNTYHVLEFSDGNDAYDYDEKMFDYDHSSGAHHEVAGGDNSPENVHSTSTGERHDWIAEGEAQAQKMTPVELSQSEVTPDGNVIKRYTTWNHPVHKTPLVHNDYNKPETTSRTTGGYTTNKGGYATSRATYQSHSGPSYGQGTPPTEIHSNVPHTPEETVAQGAHFSGQVNRQYNKLIAQLFGEEDVVSRDTVYDTDILTLLKSSHASEDIYSEASSDANEHTHDYFKILKEIHETSGLEPKSDTESSGLYIKEALEKIKADGGNVRKFVNQLIKEYK